MTRIAVIGGGASGLMAAVTAAENGAEVLLLEHKDRVGKKLLSTGNGRCNFTNLKQEPVCYHSENLLFPWQIIEKFNAQQTIAFFLKLGIYSKNRNGYLYPHSDQASAVLDVLRMEAIRLHVDIQTEVHCREIQPVKKGFKICTDQGAFSADKVILAAGSKAAPASGSDGSGYTLAKKLGHRLIPVLPSLVQLCCKENFYKGIAGVRANGRVSIYVDGECQAADTGEIQLTNYGISGIPVFQVSRYASIGLYEKKEVTAVLNFMPDFSREQFITFLKNRISSRPQKTMEEFLVGLFHKKLSDLWLKLAKIERSKKAGDCTEAEITRLSALIQGFRTEVTDTKSFEQAQVCRGGVDTKEVHAETLESLYVPGLYFAGEILDVDGICGGYNLQWAWSSGYVAGKEASHA
ncbi:NAD(P)/FAD-dependent oxidoreductase [Faecalicatena sp. AGMB00832]|uniref:NAD(P)/FAD-dependent oxidoreductase n=1 Tax=Faecalicatena faecalis TaxID=2726362 RepID=A0ABS6D5F2_9FIRM|nr:NAD(P)/FAD-dependent oxidoreductase [Faecalicatena faecalis]MBU3876780.1 NAD(P)/FAD-dependent oxidoreductase [Faecalicatena faecalis]